MRRLVAVVVVLAFAAIGSTADAKATRRKAHQVVEDDAPSAQSVGVPWSGTLRDATRFPAGDGYVIRRPTRAYGTRTTVAHVQHVVAAVRAAYPDRHVLGIGDFSAEHGGAISDHRSHQSGRDVDIGLFYREQPATYPREFVHATEANLDEAATLALVSRFAATADKDGGVQVMFLDYEVQGLLYHWGLDHGVSEAKLDRLFQFGHGRGASEGLVRHIPGHDNHLHVRFRCAAADHDCR
jgi:murein endopeptidase